MRIPRRTLRSLAWCSVLLATLLWLVVWTSSLAARMASSQAAATPLGFAAIGKLGAAGPNKVVNSWNLAFGRTVSGSDTLRQADLLLATTSATTIEAGYQDFTFHSDCNSTPTGEKPESKL